MTAALLLIAVVAGVRGIWSPCGLSMISAINPMSERSRGHRYWLTTLWFIAGSLTGGAVLGAAGALFAWALALAELPGSAALGLGALACLVTFAADRRLFSLPLHARQVNERWLTQYRRWLYAAGFGFQIGTGFATYIMTAATYLVVALAGLTGSPAWALAGGLTFGLVRGSAVLLSARSRSPRSLQGLHRRLESLDTRAAWLAGAAQAVVGGWLGWLWLGWAGVALMVTAVAGVHAAVVIRRVHTDSNQAEETALQPARVGEVGVNG